MIGKFRLYVRDATIDILITVMVQTVAYLFPYVGMSKMSVEKDKLSVTVLKKKKGEIK